MSIEGTGRKQCRLAYASGWGLGRIFVQKFLNRLRFDAINASHLHRFQFFVLDELEDRQVVNLQGLGDLFGRLGERLAGSPSVERLSWRGLLGGIRFRPVDHPALSWENLGLPELAGFPVAGALMVERLARRGILAQVCAHDWSVLRIEPPLTVGAVECGRFVEALSDAVGWMDDNRG